MDFLDFSTRVWCHAHFLIYVGLSRLTDGNFMLLFCSSCLHYSNFDHWELVRWAWGAEGPDPGQ